MAPRFLAFSAFAAGPALLILLIFTLRKTAGYDPGEAAIGKLATIVTYAASISTFLVLVEMFTGLYSGIPHDREAFNYQYGTLHGLWGMTAWMWVSAVLMVGALLLLYVPRFRRSHAMLALACGAVFLSLWMEKGLALIVGGFEAFPAGSADRRSPHCARMDDCPGDLGFGRIDAHGVLQHPRPAADSRLSPSTGRDGRACPHQIDRACIAHHLHLIARPCESQRQSCKTP